MPTYRIRSGEMDCRIKTKSPAEPAALSVMAIAQEKPESCGLMIEISGGEYKGGNVVYTSSENILRAMGLLE